MSSAQTAAFFLFQLSISFLSKVFLRPSKTMLKCSHLRINTYTSSEYALFTQVSLSLLLLIFVQNDNEFDDSYDDDMDFARKLNKTEPTTNDIV